MKKSAVASGVEIPEHTPSYDRFTLEAQEWLSRYSVGHEEVREHSILQTHDGALLFLNKNNDKVVGYQKRNIKERYITTVGQKIPMLIKNLESNILVIVEDFISAIRVGKHFNTLCLWGTKINEAELYNYISDYNNIFVWLDNDKQKDVNSGQLAAKEILTKSDVVLKKLMRKRGFLPIKKNVINIATDSDPKCYTNSEIYNIIKEH